MTSLASGNPNTAPSTPDRYALKLDTVDNKSLNSLPLPTEPCPPLSPSDDSSKFSGTSRSSSIDIGTNAGVAGIDSVFATTACPTLQAGGMSPPNYHDKMSMLKSQTTHFPDEIDKDDFSSPQHRSSTEVYLTACIEGDIGDHVIENHFKQYDNVSESRSSVGSNSQLNLSDEYTQCLTENLFLSGNSFYTCPGKNNMSPPNFKPGALLFDIHLPTHPRAHTHQHLYFFIRFVLFSNLQDHPRDQNDLNPLRKELLRFSLITSMQIWT